MLTTLLFKLRDFTYITVNTLINIPFYLLANYFNGKREEEVNADDKPFQPEKWHFSSKQITGSTKYVEIESNRFREYQRFLDTFSMSIYYLDISKATSSINDMLQLKKEIQEAIPVIKKIIIWKSYIILKKNNQFHIWWCEDITGGTNQDWVIAIPESKIAKLLEQVQLEKTHSISFFETQKNLVGSRRLTMPNLTLISNTFQDASPYKLASISCYNEKNKAFINTITNHIATSKYKFENPNIVTCERFKMTIDRQIGSGAYGTVYHAKIVTSNTNEVVVKLIQAFNKKRLSLIMHEAIVLDRLQRLHFLVKTNYNDYLIVTDFYKGFDLDNFPPNYQVNLPTLISISLDLLIDLHNTHKLNLIHNDVIEQNIMLLPTKNSNIQAKIKLIDYGASSKKSPPIFGAYFVKRDIVNAWDIIYTLFENHCIDADKKNRIYLDLLNYTYLNSISPCLLFCSSLEVEIQLFTDAKYCIEKKCYDNNNVTAKRLHQRLSFWSTSPSTGIVNANLNTKSSPVLSIQPKSL